MSISRTADCTSFVGVQNGANYTSRSGVVGCTTDNIFNSTGSKFNYGFSYESMYENRKEAELFNNKVKSEELVRKQKYENIQAALQEGREDEAAELIDEAVAELKAQGNDLPEDQLMALVTSEYTQITGTELEDDINQYAKGGFATAFSKIALCGRGDTTTKEALISKVTGRDNTTSAAGVVAGGVLGVVGGLVGWIPALFGARG